MKKSILLIATALFLFVGNQSVTAQAKIKKETQTFNLESVQASAKKKTDDLVRPLGLTKSQQEKVHSLFVKIEEKRSLSTDAKDQKAMQAKIDTYVMSSMKEILKEEQFNKYLELTKTL